MSFIHIAIFALAMASFGWGQRFTGFTQIKNSPKVADKSAKGGHVWLIDTSNRIHRFNGKRFLPTYDGCGKRIAAAVDGWAWKIGCDGAPYRWNPTLIHGNKWEKMPTPGVPLVSISSNGKESAVINAGADVWLWTDGQWYQIDCCAKSVAQGLNNDVWIIGTDGKPYQWHPDLKQWELKPGKDASYIDVAGPGQMVMTGTDGKLYVWTKKFQWEQIEGSCVKTALDGNQLYCIGQNETVSWGEFEPEEK